MAEILASLDDINAELPSDDDSPVIVADEDGTNLLQISVARVIRGNLSKTIDNVTLASWKSPETTPELIRTIAGKFIAAQYYFNRTAAQTSEISDTSFAQKRYNEAMELINQINSGEIELPEITTSTGLDSLTDLDFFPVDATDRSFTKSKPF